MKFVTKYEIEKPFNNYQIYLQIFWEWNVLICVCGVCECVCVCKGRAER